MRVLRWVGVFVVVLAVTTSIGTTQAQLIISTPAPAPAPAPGVTVRDVQLAASAPTQVPAGASITFRLSFTLVAQQPRQVETTLAWRTGGGGLQYGQFLAFNAIPGQNSDQRQTLTAPAAVTAAFDVQVFGVVRVDGTVHATQTPVAITIVPGARGPAPNPPAPAPQPTQALAPPAPPAPPENPNLARVKAALAQRGITVREVVYHPQRGDQAPALSAIVDADYVQPSGAAVVNLGSKVHSTLYQVFPLETQATMLGAVQAWQKYLIVLWARAADITTFLRANQAATTDAQRQQAWEAYVATLGILVWDVNTGQRVDVKDFQERNFAR